MSYVIQIFPPDRPVVEIEGRGEVLRAGVDFDQVPWDYLQAAHAISYYCIEHLVAQGRDPKRMSIVASHVFRILGPEIDVTKIDRAAIRLYTAARLTEGAKGSTVRRELALLQACIHHNKREERIKGDAPKFVKPPPSDPRIRWLTRDEHRALMAQPMEYRIRMFLLLAFGTGARSKAIEELEWSRVDLAARTIDFRVPGIKYRNKRRALVPIGDALYRRLESAYATRRDEFVIRKGGCTYRKVKEVLRGIGINEDGVCRHVARHTFCSWLVQAGASYAHVGRLVGDKAAMVEQVYGHLAPEHVMAAANMALLH